MIAPEPLDYSDITVNRHGGNENSAKANVSVTPKKKIQKQKIFELLCAKRHCVHSLEEVLGLSANHFSGRITALKAEGVIHSVGRCSHGSGGAIYAAKGSK